MRAGDTVKHIPSGETWIVAIVDGPYLTACGWPETESKISDCELIKACTDAKHIAMLEMCVRIGRRSQLAIKQLQDFEKSYVGMHI